MQTHDIITQSLHDYNLQTSLGIYSALYIRSVTVHVFVQNIFDMGLPVPYACSMCAVQTQLPMAFKPPLANNTDEAKVINKSSVWLGPQLSVWGRSSFSQKLTKHDDRDCVFCVRIQPTPNVFPDYTWSVKYQVKRSVNVTKPNPNLDIISKCLQFSVN